MYLVIYKEDNYQERELLGLFDTKEQAIDLIDRMGADKEDFSFYTV